MSKNHTIASISVSASASNNNINNNNSNNAEGLKGLIIAGHDGAKDYGAGEYGLTFGFNWGEYNIFVSRTYGMWLVSLYKNYKSEWTSEGRKISYDAQILDRRLGDYARGKRWSMSLAENMAKFILDAIANYEDEQQERIADAMSDLVAEAQDTFDNYVMDLQTIADNYGALETALDYYAAKQIAERIKDLGESLLSDLGAISGCEMCEEDGYWFDTAEFERWAGGYTFDHIDEIENLIDTLDYYITDAPLGFDKDTLDFELGGYEDETSFLGLVTDYPCYLWDELRDFISTRYHYAYCA